MIKVVDWEVVFSEFPDEVTLALNISGCPNLCEGCHSPHLRQDIGQDLEPTVLHDIVLSHLNEITCVGIMGGDNDLYTVMDVATYIKKHFPRLKVGWYSGRPARLANGKLYANVQPQDFDYIKVGPYIEKYGPLNSRTTNQRMYQNPGLQEDHITNWIDITEKFWKKDWEIH